MIQDTGAHIEKLTLRLCVFGLNNGGKTNSASYDTGNGDGSVLVLEKSKIHMEKASSMFYWLNKTTIKLYV